MPFCSVMRPTKRTYGDLTPSRSRCSRASVRRNVSGSMPLWMTMTRAGSHAKCARMSYRIFAETAMTRSAASTAVFSIHVDRR